LVGGKEEQEEEMGTLGMEPVVLEEVMGEVDGEEGKKEGEMEEVAHTPEA